MMECQTQLAPANVQYVSTPNTLSVVFTVPVYWIKSFHREMGDPHHDQKGILLRFGSFPK